MLLLPSVPLDDTPELAWVDDHMVVAVLVGAQYLGGDRLDVELVDTGDIRTGRLDGRDDLPLDRLVAGLSVKPIRG